MGYLITILIIRETSVVYEYGSSDCIGNIPLLRNARIGTDEAYNSHVVCNIKALNINIP